jgi:MFS transporter, NNP family, nitrate/nitrite transporter
MSLPQSGSRSALILGFLSFGACFYVWSLFGPLGPKLQHDLDLTDVELSWLVAIPVVLGSVMRIPMGILTDRLGGRAVFSSLMVYTAVPAALIAFFHSSYGLLIVLGFLLGVTGSSFAVGVPFVSRWTPPQRQGFALGVYGMGMGGTVVAALTAPTLAETFGLAAPFAIGVFLMLALGLIFWWFGRDAPVARPRTSLIETLRVFAREPRAWALTLFYFLAFGGFVAMFLYLPKLLVGVYHLQRADAGYRAAGFALLAVIARPVGGWAADRFGAERVLLVSFAGVSALAATLTGFYQEIVPLTIACLTMAVCLGLGTGAVFKMVGNEFPKQVGAVTGVVGAAGGLGGFFPPLVMGAVKTAFGSYTLGFLLLAFTGVLCLAVLALMMMRQPALASTTEQHETAGRPVEERLRR